MATITLYKEKVNGVGGLIDNLIKSSSNLDVQLVGCSAWNTEKYSSRC